MPQKVAPLERLLAISELAQVTGRAGADPGSDYFSGSLYNGNQDLMITEIEVLLIFTVGGQSVSRAYRKSVVISPQSAGDFGFTIIPSDKGFRARQK